MNEVIVANADAIKRINREMRQKMDNKCDDKTFYSGDKADKEAQDIVEKKERKKCRYFDKGFCKYKKKCRILHPDGICQEYVETQKYGNK